MFTYKLVFGLTDLKLSDFFLLRSDGRSRGHPYKLFLPGYSSTFFRLSYSVFDFIFLIFSLLGRALD